MATDSEKAVLLGQLVKKRLKIRLTTGCYYKGVLQNVSTNRSIVLDQVEDVEHARKLRGIKVFYGHEITDVELLDDLNQNGSRETETNLKSGHTLETQPNKTDIQPEKNIYLSSDKHFTEDSDQYVEYLVIDQFEQKFGPAIMHIKKQSVVGVGAAGMNICRHGKLCWLQIATKCQVYLFDILQLGMRAFRNGLKLILENRSILKVIHDCRCMSDCLFHQYGVSLNNVFDTQVADVFLFYMVTTGGFLPRYVSTLEDALIGHLEMPTSWISFLQLKKQAVKENPNLWFTRPLPPVWLRTLALEVVYLPLLRLALMDKLMSDFTSLVDVYLSVYRDGHADDLGSTELADVEIIEGLKHFRDVMQHRREKATTHCNVDEDGFLVPENLDCKKKAAVPRAVMRVGKTGQLQKLLEKMPDLEVTTSEKLNQNKWSLEQTNDIKSLYITRESVRNKIQSKFTNDANRCTVKPLDQAASHNAHSLEENCTKFDMEVTEADWEESKEEAVPPLNKVIQCVAVTEEQSSELFNQFKKNTSIADQPLPWDPFCFLKKPAHFCQKETSILGSQPKSGRSQISSLVASLLDEDPSVSESEG